MQQQQPILLVFPHPDDECFGSGGYTVLKSRAGVPVIYLCGTLGEMGRNMGHPLFANRETLPLIREQELRASCRILGITDLRLMGLRDKTVEFEDPDELGARIAAVIRETRPAELITYYPGYGVHPDHDGLARACVRALRMLPQEARPVMYGLPVDPKAPEVLGDPDLVVDISSVADVKMASIQAHRSQAEIIMARWAEMAQKDPVVRKDWERRFREERFWIYRP